MIEVFCDGASRGKSPGESACGVVVTNNRKVIAEFARGLGRRTNNEAEYEAVIAGLLICSMSNYHDPIIYTDSAVVANHILGVWQCKNKALLPLYLTVKDLEVALKFRIKQVPRYFVSRADKLAKNFLDDLEIYKEKKDYM